MLWTVIVARTLLRANNRMGCLPALCFSSMRDWEIDDDSPFKGFGGGRVWCLREEGGLVHVGIGVLVDVRLGVDLGLRALGSGGC